MADDLHSSAQKEEDESTLSDSIRGALAELRAAFPEHPITPRYWNKDYTAFPILVNVELPSRGPVGGADIRPQEPIILLLNRKSYPYNAPLVRSDRRDFPKTKFPHINPTPPGQPASFCLHRGSLDTWFAEHTIVDLVNRARGWLRDAARGRLMPDQDGFERTMVSDTFGALIYEPDVFQSTIADDWRARQGASGHSIIAYDLLDDEAASAVGQQGYMVRCATVVSPPVLKTHWDLATAINVLVKKPEYKATFQRRLFGLLIWSPEAQVTDEHFGELPQTLGAFIEWAELHGCPARDAFESYLRDDFQFFAGVPVTVAVRRPKRILGTNSDVELINFLVSAGGDYWPKDGAWDLGAEVHVSDHRTPLTPEFARHVSSLDRNIETGKILFFGCGAIGSKIAMHLARSGHVDLTLIDSNTLSPHNMVRHALGGDKIGRSKAEGLAAAIKALYPGINTLPVTGELASAITFLAGDRRADLENFRHLVDATASPLVLNALCDVQLPKALRACRMEIADNGRLGLLSVEGSERNPRLDDLQAALYDTAIDDEDVARWLIDIQHRRDTQVGSGLEDIQIGLSCSSATMRLADEVVSFHGAAVTRRLRSILDPASAPEAGILYKTYLRGDGRGGAESTTMSPVTIVHARNDPRWELRIGAGLVETMHAELKKARPSETGGLLIGHMNTRRKVVYVTRLLRAPRDSKGTPAVFRRGVFELPEQIRAVEDKTGRLLGYVGEWHTHPEGGSDLSDVDECAVAALRRSLDPALIPTLVTIVAPDGIHPHLFEPGSPPVVLRPRRTRWIVRWYTDLVSRHRHGRQ